MAAPAVTFNQRKVTILDGRSWGLISGNVNVTSYDTTHPAVAAITGKTKGTLYVVIPDAITSAGYGVTWDPVTTSFKCYGSNGVAPAAFAEAANATACGTFGFIMMCQVG